MFSSIRSATLLGIQGTPISVEVHIGSGLPGFTVVGLPDEACREARDRVRAALLSSGAEWPNKKITVNLAPSSQRKGGVGLDLALAPLLQNLVSMGHCARCLAQHHLLQGCVNLVLLLPLPMRVKQKLRARKVFTVQPPCAMWFLPYVAKGNGSIRRLKRMSKEERIFQT